MEEIGFSFIKISDVFLNFTSCFIKLDFPEPLFPCTQTMSPFINLSFILALNISSPICIAPISNSIFSIDLIVSFESFSCSESKNAINSCETFRLFLFKLIFVIILILEKIKEVQLYKLQPVKLDFLRLDNCT